MSDLGQKQELFAELYAKLILQAIAMGYRVRLGEVQRTPTQADANAMSGAGIAHSLHLLKLAGDLALLKNGVYLKDTEDYRPLGEWWKAQNPLCCWGGDFTTRPDGNHFSITHNGIR